MDGASTVLVEQAGPVLVALRAVRARSVARCRRSTHGRCKSGAAHAYVRGRYRRVREVGQGNIQAVVQDLVLGEEETSRVAYGMGAAALFARARAVGRGGRG